MWRSGIGRVKVRGQDPGIVPRGCWNHRAHRPAIWGLRLTYHSEWGKRPGPLVALPSCVEMPIDFSGLMVSLQDGFGAIPPVGIALVLLAGPTAALVVYRMIGMARRIRATPLAEVVPLWVCQDCRSVNELRLSRCYRCGLGRDASDGIEVFLDQPSRAPAPFEVPAGSPFAARAAVGQERRGMPVMTDPTPRRDSLAVGPGRDAGAHIPAAPAEGEPVEVDA